MFNNYWSKIQTHVTALNCGVSFIMDRYIDPVVGILTTYLLNLFSLSLALCPVTKNILNLSAKDI